ncbi:MAG: ZIP family metal transporter, partial [Oscillospiraceae bacterium]
FTFLATAAGAAMVFCFKNNGMKKLEQAFVGFASGVMMAASVFSLLIPCIEKSQGKLLPAFVPATVGFTVGWLFLFIMDKFVGMYDKRFCRENKICKRTRMMIFAVTLHNFPEGLAVGLAFAVAASGSDQSALAAAIALAVGIGVQNFPEGAAVSLPLKNEGMSNTRAFIYGALTGAVEPLAGICAVLLVTFVAKSLPWFLALAAGAMVYVVFAELIPQSQEGKHKNWASSGAMIGFILMMCLDVALG